PRPAPTELDFYRRDPSPGFRIEAVLGALPGTFRAEVADHLEGWRCRDRKVVPEPDGDGIEPAVRVQGSCSPHFELTHEFAREESAGARFSPRLRREINWVFDGRTRDPARQLAFYQGGLLDRLFSGVDLNPALAQLRTALGHGAAAVNDADAVSHVLAELG